MLELDRLMLNIFLQKSAFEIWLAKGAEQMSFHHLRLQSILNARDAILQKKVFIKLLYFGKNMYSFATKTKSYGYS